MLEPEKACFLIADISGYTEYLSGVEINHAQDILADLIGTVVTSLRPTFRLAKLEGDAAFCFALAEKIDGSQLLDTIERCYFGFRRRRRDVSQATSCECDACIRIPTLNLKFVAHHGLAIRQKVAGREELLGSDVIVVHRLLKNEIVEKLGIAAYAAFSNALVMESSFDPEPLGMVAHSETYDHVGEIRLWVHDLERRWQEEESQKRVLVSSADAAFEMSVEIPAPPQIVWEFMTTPGRRMEWQAAGGITDVQQALIPGGRRGVGTINHCMHGPNAIVEEILDWRPFDYFTDRSTMPGGSPTFVSTFELEPTASGTILHFRLAAPKKPQDRKQLEKLGPEMAEGLRVSVEVLMDRAAQETYARNAGRIEPPLPVRRAADGFLEEIQPIQFTD